MEFYNILHIERYHQMNNTQIETEKINIKFITRAAEVTQSELTVQSAYQTSTLNSLYKM